MKRAIQVLLLCLAAFWAGCSSEDMYIQDATTHLPFPGRTLHTLHGDSVGTFVLSGGIQAAPGGMQNSRVDGHSKVGANGAYVIDTVSGELRAYDEKNNHEFHGLNLHREFAPLSVQGSMAIVVSPSVYARLGGQYARADGTNFGSAFGSIGLFTQRGGAATVFEFGYSISKSNTRLDYAWARSGVWDDYSTVELGSTDNSATFTNFFMSLALNTYHEEWPVNIAARLGFDRQGVIEYGYHTNEAVVTADYTATFLSLTPAVIIRLNDHTVLNAGLQFAYQVTVRDGDDLVGPLPMIGLEWRP